MYVGLVFDVTRDVAKTIDDEIWMNVNSKQLASNLFRICEVSFLLKNARKIVQIFQMTIFKKFDWDVF